MLIFATLFDYNYLNRGLCLIDSLDKTLKDDYKLFILALDQETKNFFHQNQQDKHIVIQIDEIEQKYPVLLEAKSNRTKIEYYFTLSPFLPLYILETNPTFNRVTSLDSDIYFFSSPKSIFEKFGQDDILITPHDFSDGLKFLIEYGRYNVSFQSFPNTPNSLNILNDWKDKCLNWCYDILDPETKYFADQKYLDSWKSDFSNVRDIDLKTCGRAPWNIKDTPIDGNLNVNGSNLIYYHFHHLRIYQHFINHGLLAYGVSTISKPVKKLYRIYLKNLNSINIKLNRVNDNQILRLNDASPKVILWSRIWESEIGALIIFNQILFFDIKFIKRVYNYFMRKLNVIFNKS
ncbi:hypothetical protein GM921_01300 [Pedobacter sp. LMG 31464]|uniref:Glycosyl transferase n=1 Tax=Pedobacter planticolens TaxID=2679964 RepID=A0A923DX69_9SPHI|nr:hypothetical protein [Pedobacter planticolens]MBB2144108.1 hypothetical protein [Pedobacter planticolens]